MLYKEITNIVCIHIDNSGLQYVLTHIQLYIYKVYKNVYMVNLVQ